MPSNCKEGHCHLHSTVPSPLLLEPPPASCFPPPHPSIRSPNPPHTTATRPRARRAASSPARPTPIPLSRVPTRRGCGTCSAIQTVVGVERRLCERCTSGLPAPRSSSSTECAAARSTLDALQRRMKEQVDRMPDPAATATRGARAGPRPASARRMRADGGLLPRPAPAASPRRRRGRAPRPLC